MSRRRREIPPGAFAFARCARGEASRGMVIAAIIPFLFIAITIVEVLVLFTAMGPAGIPVALAMPPPP